jgi:hypothetical protein
MPSTSTPFVLPIADLPGPAESVSTFYLRETRMDIMLFVLAIEGLGADGIDARGPLPADTAFFRAGRGACDLIVAMDRDQGHVIEIGSVGDRLMDARHALLGERGRTP